VALTPGGGRGPLIGKRFKERGDWKMGGANAGGREAIQRLIKARVKGFAAGMVGGGKAD